MKGPLTMATTLDSGSATSPQFQHLAAWAQAVSLISYTKLRARSKPEGGMQPAGSHLQLQNTRGTRLYVVGGLGLQNVAGTTNGNWTRYQNGPGRPLPSPTRLRTFDDAAAHDYYRDTAVPSGHKFQNSRPDLSISGSDRRAANRRVGRGAVRCQANTFTAR